MIVGLGMDVAEVGRIAAAMEKFGQSFLDRVFSPRELAVLRRSDAAHCAGRWAAKEAAAKALGCGIGAECAFRELEILNDPAGRPVLSCAGAAQRRMAALGGTVWHLTITHERDLAAAVAVLEGL